MRKPVPRPKLKALIHERGYMTAREFCEAKGFDETQLSAIIRGRLIPGEVLMQRLADALDVTLKKLQKTL